MADCLKPCLTVVISGRRRTAGSNWVAGDIGTQAQELEIVTVEETPVRRGGGNSLRFSIE